jgi:hypothetical protein
MSTALEKNEQNAVLPGDMVKVGMDTVQGLVALQRVANLFAASSLVPKEFQNIANASIAVDMAVRMGANPLMVMQNLYIVHNRPGWSAQFLIATFNKCGRFSPIKYEYQGEQGKDEWGCRAVTTDLATRETLTGPLVTIAIAKKEGWYTKNGSKWQSLPELMLRYRAATFLVRTVAPEIAIGLQTREEVEDTLDLEPSDDGTYVINADVVEPDKKSMNDNLKAKMGKKMGTEPKAELPSPGEQPAATAPEPSPEFQQAYSKLNVLYDEHGKNIDTMLFKHGASRELPHRNCS